MTTMTLAQLQLQILEIKQQTRDVCHALIDHGVPHVEHQTFRALQALERVKEDVEKFIEEENRRGEPPTQGQPRRL